MGSLPAMTPAERMRRAQHKREKLLAFLSSEGWTDLKTAGLLLDVTPKSLSRLFLKMQAEGLLAREEISLGTSKTVIWGITSTGIVCCNSAEIDAAEHQLGRLRGANLPHHLGIQQLRIKAERAGWTNWKPGRLFYKTGLPVVPDAVATDPAGIITAIELERNVKSAARRAEVLSGHVMCMVKKHWQRVQYVSDGRCNTQRLQALYMSQKHIKTPAGNTEFTDAHRKRFRFCSFEHFAKEV